MKELRRMPANIGQCWL